MINGNIVNFRTETAGTSDIGNSFALLTNNRANIQNYTSGQLATNNSAATIAGNINAKANEYKDVNWARGVISDYLADRLRLTPDQATLINSVVTALENTHGW